MHEEYPLLAGGCVVTSGLNLDEGARDCRDKSTDENQERRCAASISHDSGVARTQDQSVRQPQLYTGRRPVIPTGIALDISTVAPAVWFPRLTTGTSAGCDVRPSLGP